MIVGSSIHLGFTVMDTIIKYYHLCTIQNGGKKHLLSISDRDLQKIFAANERKAYLRLQNGVYQANESVIGGDDNNNSNYDNNNYDNNKSPTIEPLRTNIGRIIIV
jgi:hypothetical protein